MGQIELLERIKKTKLYVSVWCEHKAFIHIKRESHLFGTYLSWQCTTEKTTSCVEFSTMWAECSFWQAVDTTQYNTNTNTNAHSECKSKEQSKHLKIWRHAHKSSNELNYQNKRLRWVSAKAYLSTIKLFGNLLWRSHAVRVVQMRERERES